MIALTFSYSLLETLSRITRSRLESRVSKLLARAVAVFGWRVLQSPNFALVVEFIIQSSLDTSIHLEGSSGTILELPIQQPTVRDEAERRPR
jgi:hypothetical protein